jgi:retron-type reverse transcriptase
VDIPKPGGKGTRSLGIAVVLDRFIQQAILQVITPLFDPHFSESSFGFRPGRSAHDAVLKARQYVEKAIALLLTLTWKNSSTGLTTIFVWLAWQDG